MMIAQRASSVAKGGKMSMRGDRRERGSGAATEDSLDSLGGGGLNGSSANRSTTSKVDNENWGLDDFYPLHPLQLPSPLLPLPNQSRTPTTSPLPPTSTRLPCPKIPQSTSPPAWTWGFYFGHWED